MQYHGSQSEVDFDQVNPDRGRYDLCFCEDYDVSEGYVLEDSDEGVVYEVEIDRHGIGPETICEILDEQGIDRGDIGPDSPYFYLLLDRTDVQECLVEQGEPVVQYEDEDWDNVQHHCTRVLEPGHVDVQEVHRVQ